LLKNSICCKIVFVEEEQMNSIIKLKNVDFSYFNTKDEVLKDVNMTVKSGDFVGIIGKNGSGKSTLIKIILGQLKPDRGTVKIDKSQKIGYVEQVTASSDSSFPANVYEIVSLGLYPKLGLFRFPSKDDKKMVSYTLESVGLKGFEKRQLSFLSGGQQQKVLIAKALVSNPDILVLDEPTTGIDKESQKEFYRLMTHINKVHKKTILMVTHDYESLSITNKIYKVDDGTLRRENKKNV